MIVLSPISLTDASFLDGSVPAVDVAAGEVAWAPGPVAKGDLRVDGDAVYKAADAIANSTVRPGLDGTRWERMRPSNRWAPFDQYIGTGQVGRVGSVSYVIRAPFINGLSIQGIVGTQLNLTITKGVGGPDLVPPVSMRLRIPGKGWWNYWFGQRTQTTSFRLEKIPLSSQAVVTITVSGEPNARVSIGFLAFGKWVNFGTGKRNYGTKWGGKLSINNYSKRNEEENGEFTLRPWGNSIDLQLGVYIPAADAPFALQELINMKDKPVAIYATDVPGFSWFNTVGFLSMDLSPDNNQDVVGAASAKGVI
ncbi:hypothetical protein [Comamonas odontotermitis]|uniref:hypothetical protein n=1 Tax=Comamonas odontotermitis TaxID=379895 RepID=UPI001CC65249|nr:hypothetical protein [Comamonas odontotermitis]UBB19544.1 hypothetical protein LAD35_22075 [Comamonas odontotermitis]